MIINIALRKLVLFVFLLTAACADRSSPAASGSDPEIKDSVSKPSAITAIEPTELPSSEAEIRTAYSAITKMHKARVLDSNVFKYDCNGEKGGTITYFSDKGHLRMIVHRYHEYDHYSAVDEYYLKRDTLFFAYKKETSWSFEAQDATRDSITEHRIYLLNEEPLRCLQKAYVIRSNAEKNPQPTSVSNNEVDCKAAHPVIKSLKALLKYRTKGPGKCLED